MLRFHVREERILGHFVGHPFDDRRRDGDEGPARARTQFRKNLSLLGASLTVSAVVAFGGEFGPSLTDPLFHL